MKNDNNGFILYFLVVSFIKLEVIYPVPEYWSKIRGQFAQFRISFQITFTQDLVHFLEPNLKFSEMLIFVEKDDNVKFYIYQHLKIISSAQISFLWKHILYSSQDSLWSWISATLQLIFFSKKCPTPSSPTPIRTPPPLIHFSLKNLE